MAWCRCCAASRPMSSRSSSRRRRSRCPSRANASDFARRRPGFPERSRHDSGHSPHDRALRPRRHAGTASNAYCGRAARSRSAAQNLRVRARGGPVARAFVTLPSCSIHPARIRRRWTRRDVGVAAVRLRALADVVDVGNVGERDARRTCVFGTWRVSRREWKSNGASLERGDRHPRTHRALVGWAAMAVDRCRRGEGSHWSGVRSRNRVAHAGRTRSGRGARSRIFREGSRMQNGRIVVW